VAKTNKNLVLLRAADAATKDAEGFRAPETGAFDVAVRARESSAIDVTLEGVAAGKVPPWSAVLVWDETGVRTGKGAGLWATKGTLTFNLRYYSKLLSCIVSRLG
jgi:hypothetical protein